MSADPIYCVQLTEEFDVAGGGVVAETIIFFYDTCEAAWAVGEAGAEFAEEFTDESAVCIVCFFIACFGSARFLGSERVITDHQLSDGLTAAGQRIFLCKRDHLVRVAS